MMTAIGARWLLDGIHRPLHVALFGLLCLFTFANSSIAQVNSNTEQFPPPPYPQVTDPRLKIELFASEPNVVTPTGIAVDRDGRVFVIESHTHFRPEGYKGPPADRILILEDTDNDGKADSSKTFFQGTSATMSIAINDAGDVIVATRDSVFRLRDRNRDGIADENTTLASLDSPGTYPHNGLSGFAFDEQDNIWFGFGENLGEPYTLTGEDGTELSGGGEGGSIFRMEPNGQNLTRMATGFWNPFHLCFDSFGQLFAVDNDPDWRPPCRLLHIVPGGDYGYRFELGRRGTHPFSSWFGEVPGTLGMVAGTGEAPSGVVCYQSHGLPNSYDGHLLVTSWGLHAIELYQLTPDGATFQSQAQTIVKGGEDFRPVGIAVGPEGALYVSDWVKRSYELHGHGRVWKISSKFTRTPLREGNLPGRFRSARVDDAIAAGEELVGMEQGQIWLKTRLHARTEKEPHLRVRGLQTLLDAEVVGEDEAWRMLTSDPDGRVQFAALDLVNWTDERVAQIIETPIEGINASNGKDETPLLSQLALAALLRRDGLKFPTDWLMSLAETPDPFLHQAVRSALTRSLSADELASMSPPQHPRARLAWALLLKESKPDDPTSLAKVLLEDSDRDVRFVGLRWIAEEKADSLQEFVTEKMKTDPDIESLFEAYLATLHMVAGEETGADFERREIELLDGMISLTSPSQLPRFFETALARLWKATQRDQVDELPDSLKPTALYRAAGSGSLNAVYIMRDSPNPVHHKALLDFLQGDSPLSPQQAAVAISGLDMNSPQDAIAMAPFVLPLSAEERYPMTVEREVLRRFIGQELPSLQKAMFNTLGAEQNELKEDIERLVSSGLTIQDKVKRASWLAQLEESDLEGADPDQGKHIFYHPKLARCGTCHTTQGFGGEVGPDLSHVGQMGLASVLQSITEPSREISPKFTAWTIATVDGRVQSGILQTERGSEQTYANAEGEQFQVEFNDIEERHPNRESLMPRGLLDDLTKSEIKDLLAYLLTLQ